MGTEGIAVVPGIGRVIEPSNTFGGAALGFEHMGNRVDGPQVVGIPLHGFAANRFGANVVASLFEREGVHTQDTCISRDGRIPGRKHACGDSSQRLGAAGPERQIMVQFERNDVQRVFGEDHFPGAGRSDDVAVDPCLHRLDM